MMSCNCGKCDCKENISLKGETIEVGEVFTVKNECDCENNKSCKCGDSEFVINDNIDKIFLFELS